MILPLEQVAARILAVTNQPFIPIRSDDGGSGCINRTTVLSDRNGIRYFVKWNDANRLSMFDAEMEGLQELERTGAVRVPRPVCVGAADAQAFIVMEYLDLNRADDTTQQRLGQQLAAMHRTTRPHFGWHRDNTIGTTPQLNGWHPDWAEFYVERRLRPQFERAGSRLRALGERLMENLTIFFTDYRPIPSLLHGDLWSGNAASMRDSTPVIFDPAVYFGDREADIAMTELFGGFGKSFYDAYGEVWPLDAGYRVRKDLYNLYHVVNHFNLFGGGYEVRAQNIIRGLLSELSR